MSLSIDIETYSSVNLKQSGVYAYVNAPDFTILLFAYAFDDEKVNIVDFTAGEGIPEDVKKALMGNTIKTAFNAAFERVCLNKYFGLEMTAEYWQCTMIQALEVGLPGRLAEVAKVLKLEEQKDTRGKALINYFCKPCKPTKANGGRNRNMPFHDIEKWEIFKEYCKQDVETERAIKNKLSRFPIIESEQDLYVIDQKINDRGVRIDKELAENAVDFDYQYKNECEKEAVILTGLDNVNSVLQLKTWIEEETGERVESLNKENVMELYSKTDNTDVKKVLLLRSQMAKTSVKKYSAMLRGLCSDNRIRGITQFYGASRTGRWAGRFVQLQNLPQNHISDLALARDVVKSGNYELLKMIYSSLPNILSELIRTAIIPSEGRRFIVSDFSAIEARVIAYLSGEKWRLEVFKNGGDIYCASASQMFKVPVEKHGINGHLRQKGKIAELALGYGGSTGALISMGAIKMGLNDDELQPLVDMWRKSSPAICNFWREVQSCAMRAITGEPCSLKHGISFMKKNGILFIGLPSGRSIAYANAKIGQNRFGSKSIIYNGIGEAKKWETIETWGGKLVENIVQAFARDCLAESIKRLESRGFEINFHVHDEVIVDVPIGKSSAKEVAQIMSEPMPWAKELPLNADAYETDFYKKD
jgi:DNA polymerase